jgi:uncharacterized damage-inducible protein DinB
MEKQIFKDLLVQNQLSCGFAFNEINDKNVSLRLNAGASSVGFIYRHIAETMLMFGYFFGMPSDVANTTMGQQDEGQGNNCGETKTLMEKGFLMLEQLIENMPDGGWNDTVDTPFFGTVSKARLFAHILYHNSYHAGQIGLTLKRA